MRELSLNHCRLDDRYDLHDRLGQGSYAEVYSARDILASNSSPHAHIVIKALNVFLQDDLDDALERTLVENFQNEAAALDRVRHPNILSRLGHGTARDLNGTVFHYLVLEYMPGGDLQSLLKRETLEIERALDYLEQVSAGLGHAHQREIIHRDIKPQNLLLTEDMSTVKIADFGVARVSVGDSPITRVGTNIYAPPEHSPMSAGRTGTLAFAKLTPSADIYSLAKTAYTLFTGESPRDYANAPITNLPATIRSKEWAPEFLRVLEKATQDDARLRQQSVEEFWEDLSGIRRIASAVGSTTVLSAIPSPHVARGYTPIPPSQPSFENLGDAAVAPLMPVLDVTTGEAGPRVVSGSTPIPEDKALKPRRRRSWLRPAATFALFAAIFTTFLYGTATYMRGRGVLPEFRNPFVTTRVATANTDIYLRPAPSTDNEPVGLVTKNSKVRIVNSQNNWYQVDIVEQGRVRPSQANATRGWLNGKYLNIPSN
ncbi:MAG TPA: serine/threonine protein kinase [Pyrinomonadaceae bacterium]|nr:serine/threonine protein kinase [Pyrinomonadaceae bacterium]